MLTVPHFTIIKVTNSWLKILKVTSKFSLPGTAQTEADNSSQVVLPVMLDGERAAGVSRAGIFVLVRGTELNVFTQIDSLGVGRSALCKVSHRN